MNNTIDTLIQDLKPVSRLPSPFKRFWPWAVLTAAYLAACAIIIGTRPDLSIIISDKIYMFELAMALTIFMSAGLSSFFLSVPDMRGMQKILYVPVILLSGFMGWVFYASVSGPVLLPHFHWEHCMWAGLFMISVPLASVTYLSRKGSTTHPQLMMFMNILSTGALGYIGLRIICPLDNIGTSFYQHIFTYVLIGIVAGFAARKVLRW